MPDTIDPAVLRQRTAAQRAEFDALGTAIAQMQAQASVFEQQAMQAARMNQFAQAAAFSAQASAARGTIAQASQRRIDLTDLIAGAISTGSTDPCDAGVTTPMLLLPLRLETRFDAVPNKPLQLRIRIFPDTVHIDALKRSLSDAEKTAGALYWSKAASTDSADTAELRWQRLGLAVGSTRAAWVAASTGPNPPPPGAGDRAVARLLPDRFVAIINPKRPGSTQAGQPTVVVGNPVAAAPLLNPLGDVPLAQGDLGKVNDAPLVKGKDPNAENNAALSPKWIADYAAAEASGLAITITTGVPATIKELVVVGVRNADPVLLAGELDALLEAHRFTDGLGFVAPGTPSNNLAEQRSGWSPDPAPAPSGTVTAAVGNRARVNAVLGIGGRALVGVPGADEDWDADARAGNAALWWPTWGTFLERIDVQHGGKTYRLTDQQRDDLRVAHRDAVRGRGPLPTLRIGRQPYGVLPVGLVADPAWTAGAADAKLLAGVRQMRDRWTKSAWDVPSVNTGTPVQQITAVQRMAPVSFALYVRQAVAKTLLADGKMDSDVELESFLDSLVLEDFFGETLGPAVERTIKDPVTGKPRTLTSPTNLVLSGDQKPLALPYSHTSDPAVLAQMAAAKAAPAGLKPQSVLQALAALALAEARRHATRNPLTLLDSVAGKLGTGGKRVGAAEIAGAQAKGSGALFALAETLRTADTDRATYARYQPDPAGAAGYAELAVASVNAAAGRELAENAQLAIVRGAAYLDEVAEALARLARPGLSTRDRAILVGEALDLASHRYDAWATALATRRIATLRAKTAAGIRIGAWGYLHDLKRAADKPKYQYIHAPSMAHAATAGILKSAYDAHKLEGSKNAFAIDLSSARVRKAMDLIDARRGGQSLGQALGYRIERAMTDAKAVDGNTLDRFIRNLRRARWTPAPAPVAAGQPTGTLVLDAAAPAGGVCDGVALLQAYRSPKGFDMLKAVASSTPADNPYLQGNWVPLQIAEESGFRAVFAAVEDALDATGDLLLAETVHQHAQGNVMRTASVADAATAGTSPVPDPTVIATPVGSRTLAHRAMLIAGPPSGTPVWPAGLRASTAPELEAWAASRLGAAADAIVLTTPFGLVLTMQGTGLSALDLVYLSGNRAGLEALVRERLGIPADTALVEERGADWQQATTRGFGEVVAVADVLRRMLVAARPATVGDFAVPHALAPVRQEQIVPALNRIIGAYTALKQRRGTLTTAGVPAATVASTLKSLVDFGITEVPDAADSQAVRRIADRLGERQAAAEAALRIDPQTGKMAAMPDATQFAAQAATAGEALFGDGFRVLTPSTPIDPATDPWSAARPSAAPRARLRRWMADMASVRPAMALLGESVLLSEALGRAPSLSAVQLAEPQAETFTTDFAGDTRPDGIALIALVERSGGGGATVGLVFDGYLEPIPDAGPRTSALAFPAPSPNARPPQTMLLAVPPDSTRWTTDRLVLTVLEAVDQAKLRGVTLERVQAFGRMLPAAYVKSWSFDDTATLDFRGTAGSLPAGLLYVREG